MLEDVVQGRAIHARVVEDGLISDLIVANAILNMYGKCRMPGEAQCVFNTMEEHDLVAWNGLITAYAQHGFGAQGLDVFRHMRQRGVKPDTVTFIGIIGACASLAALEEGRWIHASLLAIGLESDVQVGNALIHMYGKCGALGSARSVFDKIRPRNVISWTAIIAAFSQQGHAKIALQLYKEMQEERIKPDEVTYIPLLSACSHAGLVEEGRSCFAAMEKEYRLAPRAEHYVCMIDLFGRAGMLAEAEEFIGKMPHWPDERLWSALLGSCRIHSDASRGRQAAEQMIRLVPKDTSPYVLLSNLYVANSMKNDSERIHAVIDKMVELLR
jgi:pentatricopeptide repeat protein